MPAGGGPALQVGRHGGSFGLESFDGRLFYYRRGDARWSIRLVEALDSGAEREIDDVLNWAYAVAEDGVHYVRPPTQLVRTDAI